MTICLVSNLYPPDVIGGAEVYLERISRELAREHQVVVITSSSYRGLKSLAGSVSVKGNIKVYRFYPLNFYHGFKTKTKPVILRLLWQILDIWNLHAYLLIRSILKAEQPDIVHTHNLSGFSVSAVTAIKSLGLPLVHSCHDFSLLCPYATFACPLKKYQYCSSSHFCSRLYQKSRELFIGTKPQEVIFPSKFSAGIFQRSNFFKGASSNILPYCVEPSKAQSKHKRGEYFNILYVGQLVQHKGVHFLIEAFKGLPFQNIKLHIVGKGDYAGKLKALAGSDKRIIFHGSIPNNKLAQFYLSADVTVAPSLWPEVLGIVILESLSMGSPVIASSIGGITEIIQDGYNGFLFPAGDAQGLKDILEKLIRAPAVLEAIRQNARDSSLAFSTAEHCKRLIAIYRKAKGIN